MSDMKIKGFLTGCLFVTSVFWGSFAFCDELSPGDDSQNDSQKNNGAVNNTITPGPQMSLAQVLEKADERNLSFRAAELEIAKAQAQLKKSWALVLPGIKGSLEYTRMDHEDTFDMGAALAQAGVPLPPMDPMLVNPQNQLKGIIKAGISLINLQSWLTIKAAKKGVEAAKLAVEDGRQRLLMGVALTYYYCLMNRALIDMQREQVISASKHLEVATIRHKAGAGLRIDVIRAQTDLATAKQNLNASFSMFDNARDALKTLIDTKEMPMPVEPGQINIIADNESEMVAEARGARFDLKSKKAMIQVQKKQLDAAWMQFVPTLDAGGQFQYQFTQLPDLGSDDKSRWAIMFTLSVPIYNHFRYGDLDYRRAALRQAQIEEEDASVNLGLEVRTARRNYLTALSETDVAQQQYALAQEGLSLVEAAYKSGAGSSLEVTTARRDFMGASVNMVAKRLVAQMKLLELLRIMGKDMQRVISR